jgi:DNA-directed RNA polymerase subunit RPC12/RpoP
VAVFSKVAKLEAGVGCVTCSTCSFEIPVPNGQRLPKEFSVLCPHCGWRREYKADDLHDPRRDAEPPRQFPRIQFGKKHETKAEIFIQPKTRMNHLVSWFLQ